MSDAGLTNGAFYGHFTSKEDLVANVLADQLRAQRHSLDAQAPDRAGLEAFIRAYLSSRPLPGCAGDCRCRRSEKLWEGRHEHANKAASAGC